MHRGWMDNPALTAGREPFCRRAAWIWLIEEACWTERPIDIGGKTVTLQRGQLSHSVRFLAEAWKWHRSAVERLIDRLKTETMIETQSDSGRMIITICNYERYQETKRLADGLTETVGETLSRQQQDTVETNDKEGKERKEGKEEKVESDSAADASERASNVIPIASLPRRKGVTRRAPPAVATGELLAGFERWWGEYPRVRRVKRPAALKAYIKARAQVDENTLLNGLRTFRFGSEPRFMPHPTTWLNEGRWADDPEANSARAASSKDDWVARRKAEIAQRRMNFDGQTIDAELEYSE